MGNDRICRMKRKIYEKLLHWKKHSANGNALLVEGARRVGKSYIVEAFAEAEYERHLILDFSEVGRDIKDLFRNKLRNLDEFFMLLQARTGVTLKPGNSLVVFDEVQRFPRAREAIKHLVADGRFHYIETGSLVSIRKNVENILIPSEELKIQMYPMDFEEFLWALGRDALWGLVRDRFARREPLDRVDHDLAMECFWQYLVVGGMPQAVEVFADSRDLSAVEEKKRAILGLYRDDIGKFAGRLKAKVRAIWDEIPSALSRHERRFHPSDVGKNARMRDMSAAFEWLSESMTVNICHNASDPNVGLKLTEDSTALKCYMADTGLLVSHAFSENELASGGIAARLVLGETDINRGMLVENAVAQMLCAASQGLFYYSCDDREDAENRMEIDFLLTRSKVERSHNVFPVEVKSASRYSTVSLDKFNRKFGSRIARSIVLHPANVKTKASGLCLPLYMAPLLPELA